MADCSTPAKRLGRPQWQYRAGSMANELVDKCARSAGTMKPTNDATVTLPERFAAVVAAFLNDPGVTPPSGHGFGSSGLRVHGKIFAMLSSKGEYVVKLPQRRVAALVAAGVGERYDSGHGRRMQEWLQVVPTSAVDWLGLAREALAFAMPQD